MAKLVVGNKLYASWSLRAWFLMKAFGIPFDEKVLSIYQTDSKPSTLAHSPSGRVPVLLARELSGTRSQSPNTWRSSTPSSPFGHRIRIAALLPVRSVLKCTRSSGRFGLTAR
jgi:hypothetical protein